MKVETGDLDELIAAVEADAFEASPPKFNAFASAFEAALGMKPSYVDGWGAYRGSLDAAKRLHDALLPGCGWGVGDRRAGVYINGGYQAEETSEAMPPARAWLLAILRAIKAKGERG